jgi:hypothetical protein
MAFEMYARGDGWRDEPAANREPFSQDSPEPGDDFAYNPDSGARTVTGLSTRQLDALLALEGIEASTAEDMRWAALDGGYCAHGVTIERTSAFFDTWTLVIPN